MSVKPQVFLSPDLASAYRLFLRATSASVLHHPTATRNLRKLYRPFFSEAAKVEHQSRTTRDPRTRDELNKWLVEWNERVDNTLELLHSSATSRGLPHRLTRNMGFLTNAYLKSRRPKPGRAWDPNLPASSPVYSVPRAAKPSEKEKTRAERERLDATAFRALGEVVRLAEGRSGVSLGRLPPTTSCK